MKKIYSFLTAITLGYGAFAQCSISISSQTNVDCFGNCTGTANTTTANFIPAPTYSWSTSPAQTTANATNLCAGTYTVTATNGICTDTAVVTITEPAALTATQTQTDVSCFGGSNGTATALPSGGTTPYSYSWNSSPVQTTQTATGLPPGTYACTVTDANGCVTSAAVSIAEPSSAVSATVGSTAVSCNGGTNGTANVSASGGTPGYTYLWSPGSQTSANVTGLSAGTYTVTVTDANGCTVSGPVTVSQPNALAANITVADATCNATCDGVATSSPTGGTPPYLYSWSSGATTAADSGLCAGAYSVLIVDANNCSVNQAATIAEPTALTASATGTNATCVGCTNGSATATASGGTGPYTYLWTPGNQTTQTAAGLGQGTYVVCVTDANGCGPVCDTVLISDGTAIAYYEDIYDISVYPNPTWDNFEVQMDPLGSAEIVFTLTDMLGNKILSEKVFATSVFRKTFRTTGISSGIYFLQTEIDGKRLTKKIVKY
ncbi:MAG: fibronectin type III domain-containing protein [Bacteroidetes bacterium]|nr:MAG: fibronectin type III domain-containing protein [Bacteroidota bacterium]